MSGGREQRCGPSVCGTGLCPPGLQPAHLCGVPGLAVVCVFLEQKRDVDLPCARHLPLVLIQAGAACLLCSNFLFPNRGIPEGIPRTNSRQGLLLSPLVTESRMSSPDPYA